MLFRSYLCKIVRNFSLDRVREKTREKRGGGNIPLILDEMQDLLASDDDIAQTVETQELSQMISDYLREQPDRKRIIFLKRYYFASTINEIAEEQKTTEGAVKILLYRMRRELKQVLQDRGYSE